MSDDENPKVGPQRRDFLGMAIVGTAAAFGATAVVPGLAFLRPGAHRIPGSASAGRVQDFPVGTARTILLDDRPVLVIRLPDGEFKAYSAVCTHLGCIVQYSQERSRIECPCHRGVFALDGRNISGPPAKPLDSVKVEVESGTLIVRST